MSEGANNTDGVLDEPAGKDYWPPGFREMYAHFSGLPPDTLLREVWHCHSAEHLTRYLPRRDFATRAREEFGYRNPLIFSERRGQNDYRIKWFPIEDESAALDAFGRIVDGVRLR